MSITALPKQASRAPSSWSRRWLRSAVSACAFLYLTLLAVSCAALYYIGESWWVTAAALYVPRVALALPLPFLAGLLWLFGPHRLLWTQVAAAILVVFPLMGFVAPWPSAPLGHTIRVLTLNVNSGYSGARAILEKVTGFSPDVVLLEEAPWGGELPDLLRARFRFVEASTQFIVASKFRIAAVTDPDRVPFYGRVRSPRFMRYVLETPLGSVAVYCVHPLSPRGVLHLHRFREAFHQLRTGQLLAGDPEAEVGSNATLRSLQIAEAAGGAAREQLPVLIAGDTNLPGLSAVYRKWLSKYQDGFQAASSGFGYTFPGDHPFLRLDRILVSDQLRFASFQIGCAGVSDHLCVVADIGVRQ